MKGDFSLGHNIVSWPLLQIDMTTKISLVLMNQAFYPVLALTYIDFFLRTVVVDSLFLFKQNE